MSDENYLLLFYKMSRAQRLLFIAIIIHVCSFLAKISKEGYLILPN